MARRASTVVGHRIRSAREGRGWTQAELAIALGRTPTSISYWESGQRSPGLEEIVELAEALGIGASSLLPSRPPRVLARAQAEELAMSELSHVVDDLIDRFERKPQQPPVPYVAPANPAEVAAIARRMANQNVAPVRIRPIMKHFNIWFTTKELPPGLSGLVVVVADSPVIAVEKQETKERRRFTAAHELGHVLLGHHDTFHVDIERSDGTPPEYNWRHERAANEFAAALLMPAPLIREDIESTVSLTPKNLAHKYCVSVQAMTIRLSVLGIRNPSTMAFD